MRKVLALVAATLVSLMACGSPGIPDRAYDPEVKQATIIKLQESGVNITGTYETFLKNVKTFCEETDDVKASAMSQAIDKDTTWMLAAWKIGAEVACTPDEAASVNRVMEGIVQRHNQMQTTLGE